MSQNTYLLVFVYPFFIMKIFCFASLASPDSKPIGMPECEAKSCGSLLNISYPFWIVNKHQSYCGYPSLAIDCQYGIPFLNHVYGISPIISKISYENKSIFLDSLVFHKSCPKLNTSVDTKLLKFSSATKQLYLLSNCSKPLPTLLPKGYFNMSCSSTNDSVGYLERYVDELKKPNIALHSSQCDTVIVPVSDIKDRKNFTGTAHSFWPVFSMQWSYCPGCGERRGDCPTDYLASNSTCVCPNKQHFINCSLAKNGTAPAQRTVYSMVPEKCKPKNCGYLSNISYPFLLTGQQPSCGYASLQIDCNDSVPFLKYAFGYYDLKILNISHENKSILFEMQSSDDGDPCGFAKYNLSSLEVFQEYGKLKISNKNRKLYFFSNCAKQLPKQPEMDPNYAYVPICNSGDVIVAHVGGEYTDDLEENTYMSPFQCEIVTVPVLYTLTSTQDLNIIDWNEVLEYGFVAEWSYCSQGCEERKGECPQYFQAENVSCICPEKGYFASCDKTPTAATNDNQKAKGPKKHHKIAVVLGSVGGFLFIIITIICIIIYKRKHMNRKQQASQVLLPLSGSSANSSMEYDDKVAYSKSDLGTTIFTYQELEEATNGFNDSNVLGEGGFGTVYKGNLQDGRIVAIKRLYENNYKHVEQFRNEVEILSKLKHPNLVCLYGCTSRHSRELLLVYEYVPNGTVADHLHGHRASEGSLSWHTRMNIAIETADALQYLHAVKPQIIHRDVKTNNILLDSSFHVKVADFGLSRLFPLNATHVSTAPQGTPGYVDPEYYQCYQVTDKSDVYSFGVVLMELISSKPAVDVERPRQEINLSTMATNKIRNNELDQLVDQSLGYNSNSVIKKMIDMVAEVACKCLQVERDMRPNIKEVLCALRAIQSGEKVAEFDRREDSDC